MASSSWMLMALPLFALVCAPLVGLGGATSSLSQVYYVCSPTNYTANSEFAANLETLFSRLVAASSTTMYANVSAASGSGSESAYGVFQCRGDVSQVDCAACVSVVADAIKGTCPMSVSARQMLDSCLLRYDNSSVFYDGSGATSNTSAEMDYITRWCNDINNTDTAFQEMAKKALENVTAVAPLNGGFAVDEEGGGGGSTTIFALAECFGYVSPKDCQACLSNIEDASRLCPTSIGVQVHYSGCYYRYETGLFYTLPSSSSSFSPSPAPAPAPAPSSSIPSSAKSSNKGLIVGGVAVASFVVLMGALILCICLYQKKAKRTRGRSDKNLGPLHQSITTVFSYDELKAATQNFAEENKLGEGGFGPVYKGKFDRDSLEVAIKKLSSASNQGKQEFMNEVNIITSVQHHNLIRLLGCCVEGTEKLLVYEYLPNKSLDQHLFDPPKENPVSLDWATRFGIILGTARGLAYLHHDSQVRIIHRDIKPSNILLANDLTPKIADFGLARFIADDVSHVTTRVAGTLGYLAPEYAMHGQLTEKADVFSFGMLTLEVVSGRKNSEPRCPPEKQHLLEWAWQAYREGRHTDLVDEKLGGKFFGEEVVRVVHVALLCTQSHPTLRPTMSHVIQLLVGQSNILDKPTAPPFVTPSPFDLISSSSSTSSSTTTTTVDAATTTFSLMSHGHVSDMRSVDTLAQLDENATYDSSTFSHIQAR